MEIFACDASTGTKHVVDVGEKLTFKGLKAAIAKLVPIEAAQMVLTHAGVEVGGVQEEDEQVGGSAVESGDEVQVTRDNTEIKKQLRNGRSLLSLPPWVRADRALVEAALEHGMSAVRYATEELRSDKSLLLKGLDSHNGMDDVDLSFVGKSLWDDKEFVLVALSNCSTPAALLNHVSPRLRKDKEVGLVAIEHHDIREVILFLDESLRNCPDFMLKCLAKERGKSLEPPSDEEGSDDDTCSSSYSSVGESLIMMALSDSLRNDLVFMRKAVRLTTDFVLYANDLVRSDAEVMGYAVRRSPTLISLCSDSLRNCDTFMRTVLTRHPELLGMASPRLRADPELAMAALESGDTEVLARVDPIVFKHRPLLEKLLEDANSELLALVVQHCGDELLHDEQLILKALQEDIDTWGLVPSDLRHNKAFVLRCLEADVPLYTHLDLELRCDPEVAQKSGCDADTFPFELLNDAEFAIEYMSQDRWTQLSDFRPLLGDRKVVLAALQHNADALSVALPGVRRDPEAMLLAAHATNGESLKYIMPELAENVDFYLKIVEDTEYVSHLPETEPAAAVAVAERITSKEKKEKFATAMQSAPKLQKYQDPEEMVSSRYSVNDEASESYTSEESD
eukprot:TRINITY_DN1297_c1_g3_i1.p1 TRINITY_DN1297_c1_g3~~TRINITY_DN1297_c1_g3_i1.p1  ORF type:complete len:652 (+),score=202.57 TRINITY_DN1297_c1_g3_i1:88-1956(+)